MMQSNHNSQKTNNKQITMTKIRNSKQSVFDFICDLNIEICDLFEIWCLRFGIFNTSVSFSIKLSASSAGGGAEAFNPEPLNPQTVITYLSSHFFKRVD
jgi:hypothetical protein